MHTKSPDKSQPGKTAKRKSALRLIPHRMGTFCARGPLTERTPPPAFVIFLWEVLMKTFWQHENGGVYVVEGDSLGRITGAAGPLELDKLRDPSEYKCLCTLGPWIARAIAQRKVRRINPAVRR
jgi:hypothetical protein